MTPDYSLAASKLKETFDSLADIWQLSAHERACIAGEAGQPAHDQEKQVVSLQIRQQLLRLMPENTLQAQWLRNATAPQSPLGGAVPLDLMMQGLGGLRAVRDYLAHRADR